MDTRPTLSQLFYQLKAGSGSKLLLSAEELAAWVFSQSMVQKLLQQLGHYQFQNPLLLLEALAHGSFVHENPNLGLKSYEQLEFLGDAVLDLHISELLLKRYPHYKEGELSKFRSALVNEQSLGQLADCCALSRCLLLGKGELTLSNSKRRLTADMVESVLGAIYLDRGFTAAQKAMDALFLVYQSKRGMDFIATSRLETFDVKTQLQELTMSLYKQLPRYVMLSGSEQASDQLIVVELFLGDKKLASASASSKKLAERELAKRALTEKLYLILDTEKKC